ncbi:MAG: arylsulfatase, partial [Planctomycetaceae bacterium]|nr:arylsulfatase [Planctomycetaceae bacterium]
IPARPGKSLVPVFAKDGDIGRDYLWWFHEGNRAIRVGNWKAVTAKNIGNDEWELYDMTTDRSEMKNLAATNSEKLAELVAKWSAITEEFTGTAARE